VTRTIDFGSNLLDFPITERENVAMAMYFIISCNNDYYGNGETDQWIHYTGTQFSSPNTNKDFYATVGNEILFSGISLTRGRDRPSSYPTLPHTHRFRINSRHFQASEGIAWVGRTLSTSSFSLFRKFPCQLDGGNYGINLNDTAFDVRQHTTLIAVTGASITASRIMKEGIYIEITVSGTPLTANNRLTLEDPDDIKFHYEADL
jgi:hypothetical protein